MQHPQAQLLRVLRGFQAASTHPVTSLHLLAGPTLPQLGLQFTVPFPSPSLSHSLNLMHAFIFLTMPGFLLAMTPLPLPVLHPPSAGNCNPDSAHSPASPSAFLLPENPSPPVCHPSQLALLLSRELSLGGAMFSQKRTSEGAIYLLAPLSSQCNASC